jgi:hypothetical protein
MDRCKQDGDYFRAQLGADRGFLVTFDTYTEESIEAGDTEDGGYSDYESMEPDEFDTADNVTAVDKAIHYLTRDHSVMASSSHFHPGVWYSDSSNDQDYRTGEETQHSYHPTNFSVEEQRAIFNGVR